MNYRRGSLSALVHLRRIRLTERQEVVKRAKEKGDGLVAHHDLLYDRWGTRFGGYDGSGSDSKTAYDSW